MEKPLGDYSVLATGGTFGDVLFFFCSGYTIFLGKDLDFFNWYKRRINRIYPSVFAWALLASAVFGIDRNMPNILIHGGGWFVSCIMIYYVFLWFIRKYAINKIPTIAVVVLFCCVAWYLFIGTGCDNNSMYGESYFKWLHYFLFMLMGAVMGLRYKEQGGNRYSLLWSSVMILVSIMAFYALFSFYKKDGLLNAVQLLSLIPLAFVCLGFYRFCNTEIMYRMYNSCFMGAIIKFVGGLCLEIYLVQAPLLTDKYNSIFPANVILILIAIVLGAYILRCLSRFWSQTFKDGDYDIKAILKTY